MASYQIELIRLGAVRVRIEAPDDRQAHYAWHEQPTSRPPAHPTSIRTLPANTDHRNRNPHSSVPRSPKNTEGMDHDD